MAKVKERHGPAVNTDVILVNALFQKDTLLQQMWAENKRMPAVNVQVLLTELCPILALRSKGVGLAQMMRERCSYFIKTVWALFSTVYGMN